MTGVTYRLKSRNALRLVAIRATCNGTLETTKKYYNTLANVTNIQRNCNNELKNSRSAVIKICFSVCIANGSLLFFSAEFFYTVFFHKYCQVVQPRLRRNARYSGDW